MDQVKQFQFEELLASGADISNNIRLMRMIGKNKGRIGFFNSFVGYGSDISVKFGEEFDWGCYTKFEFVDENDIPILFQPRDMTARTINIGDYIVYSVSAGRSNHALEMGKVQQFSAVGAPLVKRIMNNGRNISSPDEKLKTINDPDRCITLPISESNLIMWLLKDFKDLEE